MIKPSDMNKILLAKVVFDDSDDDELELRQQADIEAEKESEKNLKIIKRYFNKVKEKMNKAGFEGSYEMTNSYPTIYIPILKFNLSDNNLKLSGGLNKNLIAIIYKKSDCYIKYDTYDDYIYIDFSDRKKEFANCSNEMKRFLCARNFSDIIYKDQYYDEETVKTYKMAYEKCMEIIDDGEQIIDYIIDNSDMSDNIDFKDE